MTTAPRPIGVTLVAVLLFISAAVGIIAGVLGLIGAGVTPSATVEGVQLDSTGLSLLAGFLLVIGILNLIFAFGILRGSRVARMIVTILQLVTIVSGVVTMVTAGGQIWHGIYNLLMPILIVALLWMGAATKDFFAKR